MLDLLRRWLLLLRDRFADNGLQFGGNLLRQMSLLHFLTTALRWRLDRLRGEFGRRRGLLRDQLMLLRGRRRQ